MPPPSCDHLINSLCYDARYKIRSLTSTLITFCPPSLISIQLSFFISVLLSFCLLWSISIQLSLSYSPYSLSVYLHQFFSNCLFYIHLILFLFTFINVYPTLSFYAYLTLFLFTFVNLCLTFSFLCPLLSIIVYFYAFLFSFLMVD